MKMNRTDMSPVTEAWSACRTSSAQDWPPDRLLQAKGHATVSVIIPARNEEATIGTIVTAIRSAFIQSVPLVDEVIVVDSRSVDGTAAAARAAGASVVSQDDITRGLPPMRGKGDAMWAGLTVASGDVIAFIDADVHPFDPRFVSGLLGPLLTDPSISFVKGFYHRPLTLGGYSEADGGGRVTELVARPLLNLFWPDLAGFVQPLAGESAGRRDVLARVPFVSGYGVEIAMLVDLLNLTGLDALAQVDLGERAHRNQSIEALGQMAAQILLTAWSRLVRQGRADASTPLPSTLTQFRRGGEQPLPNLGREIVISDVAIDERPPMITGDRVQPTF
ncbi:MAG: glucosyl-3-phosphoglycerate synthase [Actinomycetota bacterium]|nr:glucosyl-3-phosphoglycerate synthase [Actinomycetota bacterium]